MVADNAGRRSLRRHAIVRMRRLLAIRRNQTLLRVAELERTVRSVSDCIAIMSEALEEVQQKNRELEKTRAPLRRRMQSASHSTALTLVASNDCAAPIGGDVA